VTSLVAAVLGNGVGGDLLYSQMQGAAFTSADGRGVGAGGFSQTLPPSYRGRWGVTLAIPIVNTPTRPSSS
jgi:hypothetical protein